MSESDRWERITSTNNDSASFPEDEAGLREAWLSLKNDLDRTSGNWAGPDPDDVWAAISRVERRRRQSFWMRTSAVAAGILLMVGVIGASYWNGRPPVVAEAKIKKAPVLWEELVWEDGWEESAAEIDGTLVAVADSIAPPPSEPWIDLRIQELFVECVRVWQTL